MRKAKLWSMLLAAVLLCACIAGVLIMGASASDSRIPTPTVTYTVGTDDGSTIRNCLSKATTAEWGKDDVLEIVSSSQDNSIVVTGTNKNRNLFWATPTIFRADGTKLPIIIRGADAKINIRVPKDTAVRSYTAANDYYFTNVNFGTSMGGATIYAGSGKVVFENVSFTNSNTIKYYGDCDTMDAFVGWEADNLAANSNNGFLETGIVFGKDVTFSGSLGSDFLLAAVGFDGDATTNGEIFGYKVEAVNPTFTDSNVGAVKAAAETATFAPGNNITSNCLVKPCNLSASVVLDNGKVSGEAYDYPRACARKGVSPVAKATVEMRSGDVEYIYGDNGSADFNETFVGDTKVIFRGGYISSIRLATLSMWVGDMTVEVHEDSSTIPTYTPFIQPCPNPNTSTAPESATKLFGNYHFLMTGGTLGKGTEAGYYGALQATGTVVNEVRGGALSKFTTVRYGNQFPNEATPISKTITLDEKHTVTLNETVTVHNKISGGIFGSLAADDSVVAGTGFFAGADRNKHDYQPASVCNEISGGTFYNFTASGTTVTNKFESDIYNFISGNDTKFHCEFHGAGSTSVTNNVVNVIEGSPTFQSIDGETNLDIYGGTTEGTVGTITNYLLGTPVFGDFSGGSKGDTNAGVVDSIVNHIALNDSGTSTIYGGNGDGNSANVVNQKLETTIYSGKYNAANIRAMSRVNGGKATCDTVFSIYGGNFSGEFMPVNGGYGESGSGYKVINNIYGGTFGGRCLMGSKQICRIAVENNVSGGTFIGDYVGAGRSGVASVTNNISGGEFNGAYYGGQDSGGAGANNCTAIINNISGGEFKGAYYGGGAVSIGNAPITNTITGGIFNGVYYGGGAVSATTVANNVYAGTFNNTWYGGLSAGDCTSITNHFYGGQGNASENKPIYCGSAATFTGTITNTFHAPGENGSGFDAKMSFVYGGGSANHANTTAESAILNTINGGTFIGFFGSNGGGAVDGKVKTVVNGGTFNPLDATNNNKNVVITGGTRGNGTTNGDVTLEINGGTFNGEVVGGATYTSGDTASGKTVNANVTVTIKGGTFYSVNGRPLVSGYTKSTYLDKATLADGKTSIINGVQVENQAMALYGEVVFDSFAANGQAIDMDADSTEITIKDLSGKIVLNQTEGWTERTYAILPVGSQYEVTESPEIFGAYAPAVTEEEIVIKGFSFKLAGATIRLADRLGVRFLLNIDDVDNIGAAFNYKVTMGADVLAKGTKDDLEEHQGYYSFVIDGIGLAQFGDTFKISSDFMTDETYSIVGLAELAQTAWTDANWKAYAEAIIEFHKVYNLEQDNSLDYNEVKSTPSAAKGELGNEITSAKATLLMSDAAGVRLTVTLDAAAPADAKFVVEGKKFAATVVDGNTISADIFFAHEVLDEEFVISVQNAEGQAYMTYTASIEGMAHQLAIDGGNENQKNARAFLCYIQKAVACK